MKKNIAWSLAGIVVVFILAILVFACQGPQGERGPAGPTGPAGPQGPPGPLPPGVERDIDVDLTVSAPSNGTYFAAGERPVITIVLKDGFGSPRTKDDFGSLNLYMYGPQEPTKTVTAVKLLNASTDRSQRPHHYIALATDENVQVEGNVLKYTLQPITDEEPGTYTVTVWASLKDAPLQQMFPVVDLQIGTATVETQVVEREKCGSCHLGADSGRYYFHHIDPGHSPTGNPSIDSWPVRTCKSCHNNDGYAAYRLPTDPDVRVPDPIVNRVHGVHMGEHLESALNIGFPEENIAGVFADYLHVEFPANVKNCTTCHVDDRWKTEPSRLACGACHDNIWFGAPAEMPATAEAHAGGPQLDDQACVTCHPADTGGLKAVAEAHKVEPPAFKQIVELSMSAPANGEFYVAGETPTVTITIKDATGTTIDPNTIVEPADAQNVQPDEWRRANLYVSGPRNNTKPVLTTTASHDEYDHYYANNDFRVRNKSVDEDPKITRYSTAITYQLDDVAGLTPGTYTAFVEIMAAAPVGAWDVTNFQVGTETEDALIATNCTSCHANDVRMHSTYFAVQFNPDICKSCHDYERQMPGKASWTDANSGFGAGPLARRIHGVHFGHYLDKPEEVHQTHDYSHTIFPQDVRNCTKCHDTSGSPAWKEEPSRLACNACHDSDIALTHTSLMTQDPTPADPWSGDEIETCETCHGTGKDFSPDKVHDISEPYVPPYPREHPH